ncbi:hypothetical protein LLE56_20435, partial [Xanthomonas campestris]|uniref:hypothetical protein n=1 Tax=Xanthomonas campestris TaxID=339 RepID=UPI001E463179
MTSSMYERCKGQRDSCFATISRVCGLDWTPNNSSKLWWAAMCRCSGGAAWLPRTLVEGRGQKAAGPCSAQTHALGYQHGDLFDTPYRRLVSEPVHDLLSNSAKKAKWMNCRLVLSL